LTIRYARRRIRGLAAATPLPGVIDRTQRLPTSFRVRPPATDLYLLLAISPLRRQDSQAPPL
jgi:hypothetical protein